MKSWNPLHWGKQESQTVTLQTAPEANTTLLFSFKDKKIDQFEQLFEAPNVEEIKAGLVAGFRDPKASENRLFKFAKDFDLYEMGKVNRTTGKVTGLDAPRLHFSLEILRD